MYKKFLFLISFVLVLNLVSISYGADPRMIKLDLNNTTDNNDANTEEDFTKFILANSGSEVNGVVIDLVGDLRSARRSDPSGSSRPAEPLNFDKAFRDFVFGVQPSGVTIKLYGLGVNRECDVYMWAYDHGSVPSRLADWWATWGDAIDANYMFTTDFNGTLLNWPPDIYWYWLGTAKTDKYGRLILTSTRHTSPPPVSPENEPFAFVNALVVEPKGTYTATKYAQRPVPFDGTQNVPVTTSLKWRKGEPVVKHDLYLGTDETAVTNATRASHPGVTIYAPDLAADANKGYDPYGATGFLKLDKTYYWRIDENTPPLNPPGEVWSFKTLQYSVNDNFDSYPSSTDLKLVWEDYWVNGSTAEVFTNQVAVRSGQSMKYLYNNKSYAPYYAEANAAVASLGLDPNWFAMDAKALSLWFYGDPCNPVGEHDDMYVKLVDSDTSVHIAKVLYGDYGDMNNVRKKIWQEWNIPLEDFTGVNLKKVSRIVIGFGDGTPAVSDGNVFFEDIRIYATRCALAERSADIALVDYAPSGAPAGDCVVDYQEFLAMADTWFVGDEVLPTKNPNDVNLVLYYPLNEGDGNKVYPAAGSGGKSGNLALWTGTTYNSGLNPPRNTATLVSTDHAPGIGGTGCVYFNGDNGVRLQCGTYGQAALGIGALPGDTNAITVSAWIKPLGQRTWDSYLASKGMGILGKRGGWDDASVIWFYGLHEDASLMFVSARTINLYTGRVMPPFFGKWVHTAFSYPNRSNNPNDSNSYVRVYVNGGQVTTGRFHFDHGVDANIMLSIGNTMDQNSWNNSPEGFYGYIDEVRIYDRALEPNEIAYLADPTPGDGYLQIPVPSNAEVYAKEPVGQQIVNFKDFALVANKWLAEDLFP